MGKWCRQASSFIFDRIFIKLVDNQDRHKLSEEFEFQPDRISHFGVTCPCGQIRFSTDILWNLQVQLTFQTLEFFVTLFSGTVRPRRLKLGTHVGSGHMYHVYLSQTAAAYLSLYFFIFLFQFLARLNNVHGELLYYPWRRRWRWRRHPQMLKFCVYYYFLIISKPCDGFG